MFCFRLHAVPRFGYSQILKALWIIILLAADGWLGHSSSYAATVVIDHDTTISAASPISESHIDIIDGSGGPANVTIIGGGTVVGFTARQNSTTTLDGGQVTFLSSLHDHATFVMRNGRVGCFEPVCSVIDPSSYFSANDFSVLHFFGGSLEMGLTLNDSSELNMYGYNLTKMGPDPISWLLTVEGTYVNGVQFSGVVEVPLNSMAQVVLHEVPEPATAFATSIAVLIVLVLGQRYRLYTTAAGG